MVPSAVLVVFISLVGFGMVYPSLPFQAAALGACPQTVILLLGIHSIVSFLIAPVLGHLSDYIGRKAVILAGFASAPIAYMLMASAESVEALFVSRALAGVGLASVSVTHAYVADWTKSERRAPGMAGITASFGLAFTLGPTIAILTLGPAGDDYRNTALYAAGFSLSAVILGLVLLRSRTPNRLVGYKSHSISWQSSIRSALAPGVSVPAGTLMIFAFVYAGMDTTIGMWSAHTLNWGARQLSIAFTIAGASTVVSLFVFMRLPMSRFGEQAMTHGSAAALFVGLVILILFPSPFAVGVAMVLMGGGIAVGISCLKGLISNATPDHLQGSTMGISYSGASLARVLGPLWGAFCFENFGVSWPYISGALLIIGAVVLLAQRPRTLRASNLS